MSIPPSRIEHPHGTTRLSLQPSPEQHATYRHLSEHSSILCVLQHNDTELGGERSEGVTRPGRPTLLNNATFRRPKLFCVMELSISVVAPHNLVEEKPKFVIFLCVCVCVSFFLFGDLFELLCYCCCGEQNTR